MVFAKSCPAGELFSIKILIIVKSMRLMLWIAYYKSRRFYNYVDPYLFIFF